ncbi:hypothetical protein D5S17_16255 [Pseudonocardiaceae bacterium YIM PH 21723]|nr:hypothetical protein D5S17_16255 [Pseudonocardiaceae bacterium YIM PH 21723]
MQWMTLASTAFGAVIALLATMLNERSKWRREQIRDRRKLAHETYVGLLAAFTEAHERMRSEFATGARGNDIRNAFRDAGCYAMRYQLALVAQQDVVDHGERAFKSLRKIRDLLAEGRSLETEEYKELRRSYSAALRELQLAMRGELNVGPVQLEGGS